MFDSFFGTENFPWWAVFFGVITLTMARWRQYLEQVREFKRLWTAEALAALLEAGPLGLAGVSRWPTIPQPPMPWHVRIWATVLRLAGYKLLYVIVIRFSTGATGAPEAHSILIGRYLAKDVRAAVGLLHQTFTSVPLTAQVDYQQWVDLEEWNDTLIVAEGQHTVLQYGRVKLFPRQRGAY